MGILYRILEIGKFCFSIVFLDIFGFNGFFLFVVDFAFMIFSSRGARTTSVWL